MNSLHRTTLFPLFFVLCTGVGASGQERDPGQILDTAIANFAAGRIEKSLSGFDAIVALAPEAMPGLWQRGIALYDAGRWEDCRTQFEIHRTVNPDDVENAVWRYLCVARLQSPAAARKAMLPAGPQPNNTEAEGAIFTWWQRST